MLRRRAIIRSLQNARSFSSEYDPLKRVWERITSDFHDIASKVREADHLDDKTFKRPPARFPYQTDIVVVGNGLMAASVAFWLKQRARHGIEVVVVEQPYSMNLTPMQSFNGLKQQYSLPENIQMALFGADFLRNAKAFLGEDVDLKYTPHGHLYLADEAVAETIENNIKLQKEYGCRTVKLTAKRIKETYPWINTDGIKFGCIGMENEGWFDPWALLWGLKRKCIDLGAKFVQGEVKGFTFKRMHDTLMEGVKPGTYQCLDTLKVQRTDEEIKEIKFARCVLAAEPDSKIFADMIGIGKGEGMLSIPLSTEIRKRCAYLLESESNGIDLNVPLVNDVSGFWLRREGFSNFYVAGRPPNDDTATDNLEVDFDYFHNEVMPCIAHRIPALKDLKVRSGVAAPLEYNTFDENGIIGQHPYHENLFFTSGFLGQGLHNAIAVGRATSEIILEAEYITCDLTRLCFDRLITNDPIYETNMI